MSISYNADVVKLIDEGNDGSNSSNFKEWILALFLLIEDASVFLKLNRKISF